MPTMIPHRIWIAIMAESRTQVRARVLPFIMEMMRAEAKAHGLNSAGELLEQWTLAHAKSSEAQKVLIDYGKTDTVVQAVRKAEMTQAVLNDRGGVRSVGKHAKKGGVIIRPRFDTSPANAVQTD